MCCNTNQGVVSELKRKHPSYKGEFTAYKVVHLDGRSEFPFEGAKCSHYFQYTPGVHVSSYGPGFHVYLNKSQAKNNCLDGYETVLAVRAHPKNLNAAGYDEARNVQTAVFSKLRIDHREWRRAGLPC